MTDDPTPRFRALRILAAVVAVVVGLVVIVVTLAVGHCSAFGGRCPAESPPLIEDDVFGTTAAAGFLAVAAPVWLAHPSWRRLGRAIVVGGAVGLVIGLLARGAAAG